MKQNSSLLSSIFIWGAIATLYVILFSFIENDNRIIGGFSRNESVVALFATIKALILATGTLIGIMSKLLFEEIEKTKFFVGIGGAINKVRTSRELWLSFLVCPAIIASFYESLKEVDNLLLIGIFSYQNGFFFRALLGQRDKTKD
jgi:hypothetical protein